MIAWLWIMGSNITLLLSLELVHLMSHDRQTGLTLLLLANASSSIYALAVCRLRPKTSPAPQSIVRSDWVYLMIWSLAGCLIYSLLALGIPDVIPTTLVVAESLAPFLAVLMTQAFLKTWGKGTADTKKSHLDLFFGMFGVTILTVIACAGGEALSDNFTIRMAYLVLMTCLYACTQTMARLLASRNLLDWVVQRLGLLNGLWVILYFSATHSWSFVDWKSPTLWGLGVLLGFFTYASQFSLLAGLKRAHPLTAALTLALIVPMAIGVEQIRQGQLNSLQVSATIFYLALVVAQLRLQRTKEVAF